MTEILFLPYLNISEPISINQFTFSPYSIDELESNVDDQTRGLLNNHLEALQDHGGRSINRVVLLFFKGSPIIDGDADLDDEISLLIDLLSFCGLSNRDFFNESGCNYCNKENFTLFRIPNKIDPLIYTVITRRRDRIARNSILYTDFKKIKQRIPEHVFIENIEVDSELLKSLIEFKSKKRQHEWECIYLSILNFNLANTDNTSIDERAEIVFLVSAFERLFNCGKGDESTLTEEFIKVFPSLQMDFARFDYLVQIRKKVNIKEKFKKCKSMPEIWIRDFFRLRGQLAHGKFSKPKETSFTIWSLKEHLLLGGFIFPLVLNLKLNRATSNDKFYISIFEDIVCQENIFKSWNQVVGNAKRNLRIEKYAEAIMRRDLNAKSYEHYYTTDRSNRETLPGKSP